MSPVLQSPVISSIRSDKSRGPIGSLPSSLQVSTARQEAKAEIQRLFDACLNPKLGISKAAWREAAKTLGVEIAAVKAVAQVESKQSPFDENGHPTILFERTYFQRLTNNKYDVKYPKISGSHGAGEYGKFSAQYVKIEQAYGLNPTAALKSASWGKFQIMGENFAAAGYSSVENMVRSMMESEQNQLDAFVNFVNSSSVRKKALQKKDWAGFAKAYNGSGYAKNKYDEQMKDAYTAQSAEDKVVPNDDPKNAPEHPAKIILP